MSAVPQPDANQRMTVAEFLAFEAAHPDGRYEYIDGYVRDLYALMMAGGSNNHAIIAANVISALDRALGDRPCRVYSADVKLLISDTAYLHPDVAVSCDARDAQRNDGIAHPCLVVEVLSPSTEAFDRSRKLALYTACPTIQEVVLIDARRPVVDVYQRLDATTMRYRSYGADEEIVLASVDAALAVAACYRRIAFEADDGL